MTADAQPSTHLAQQLGLVLRAQVLEELSAHDDVKRLGRYPSSYVAHVDLAELAGTIGLVRVQLAAVHHQPPLGQ